MKRAAPVFALWTIFLVPAVEGQDAGSARTDYLAERGLQAGAADIALYLADELSATGHGNPQGLGEFFSFIMVLHGLDLDKVIRLQAGGIDVVHAMTSDARPFIEQGLFSDPAVLGEVVDYRDAEEPHDGYESTIAVRVLDRLKGEATPDTVYLRQRRAFSEGMGPRDMVPEVGERYLLLLSRPMYEYAVWRRARNDDRIAEPQTGYYAIYRYYRTDDERVVMGDGSSYNAEPVYQELRWLQDLIDEL